MPICLAQEADMSVLLQQELIKQAAGTPATVALKYIVRPQERTMAAKLPVMHLLCLFTKGPSSQGANSSSQGS